MTDIGKSNNAIAEIINEFDTHQLIAIGESHGWKEESEFIFDIIKDPSFSKKVNDIVVECGNAGYQPLMDAYINGKDIPETELQQVWRNMTVICTCDAPIYEELFQTVRAVNQKLKLANKIRVLLGEPPIDWKKINKSEDLGPWIFKRDEYYSGVVEKEVIKKKRKALLIMGSLHFIKAGWGVEPAMGDNGAATFNNAEVDKTPADTLTLSLPDSIRNEPVNTRIKEITGAGNTTPNAQGFNVSQLIEKKYPGKLFIVLPYDGYGDIATNKKIESKLGDVGKPGFMITEKSWIGNLNAGTLFGRKSIALTNGKITGEVVYNPYPNLKISDLCDAYLYISSKKNMTRSVPSAILKDVKYLKELNRRSFIINGKPFRLNDYTDTSLKFN